MDGWMDKWMDGWMDGWMKKQTNGLIGKPVFDTAPKALN